MEKLYLINVVEYNGVEANVFKFIGFVKFNGFVDKDRVLEVTENTKSAISEYPLKGDGKILLFDPLYPLTLEQINAMKIAEDEELRAAYYRFNDMFF